MSNHFFSLFFENFQKSGHFIARVAFFENSEGQQRAIPVSVGVDDAVSDFVKDQALDACEAELAELVYLGICNLHGGKITGEGWYENNPAPVELMDPRLDGYRMVVYDILQKK